MIMGELNAKEIDELLRTESVVRLACQAGGQPYVVPLIYTYDGESITVHSLEGTKIDMMRANPRVCVEVDHIENPASWRSVVAFGDYEELSGDDAKRALDGLVERFMPRGTPKTPDPFAPPSLRDRVVLFRVHLRERSGRFARQV